MNNQSVPASIQHEFPPELNANSASLIVPQTFGWVPAAIASEFVLFLIYASIQSDILKFTKDTSEFAAGAAIAVLPLLLFAYEFWRRQTRRTFARLDKSNQVGIYRRGVLERAISVDNIGIYIRNHTNTYMLILWSAAPALAFGGLFVKSIIAPGGTTFSTGEKILQAASSLCFIALLVSVIRTRLFCKVLLLPRNGPRGFQSFLVRKEEAPGILRQF